VIACHYLAFLALYCNPALSKKQKSSAAAAKPVDNRGNPFAKSTGGSGEGMHSPFIARAKRGIFFQGIAQYYE
jgi:hypothetical protein